MNRIQQELIQQELNEIDEDIEFEQTQESNQEQGEAEIVELLALKSKLIDILKELKNDYGIF